MSSITCSGDDRPSGGTAAARRALRDALRAFAAALDSALDLDRTIERLERALGAAFGAGDVAIRLYLEATNASDDDRVRTIFPLTLDGETIGSLAFAFAAAPDPELAADLESLVPALTAALLWRMQSEDRARLRKIARTDTLTGLANRLAFDERFEAAMRGCSERGAPLALTFLDIDFFKAYNDVYGHVSGDDCLREVARLLAEHARPDHDLIARYGGEEFALISEDTTEAQALAATERMLAALTAASLPHAGSSLGRVTLSAGISARVPTIADLASDLMRDADRALYRAKMLGRNRVAASGFVSNAPIVTRQSRLLGGPPPFDDETVGRDAEIARISAALRNARMITLVGPAGIGKSRLARAVGLQAHAGVPDGVAYVDLAVVDAGSDPLEMLAAALDVGLDGRGMLDAIVDLVRDREMLLILDDAASPNRRVETLCERLLEAAPALAILATARHPLGCAEERVVVVPPLDHDAALALMRRRSGYERELADAGLRRIAKRTGGIPSSIEAIARHLAAHGLEATLQRLPNAEQP